MPEGDAVLRSCRRLHAALAGQVLTRAELRVPSAAAANLTGRTVLEVVPRGKHQLTRVEGGWTIHTHLRMDGTWRIVPPGQRAPGPAHQIRVLLGTATCTAVGLRLGEVDLVRTAREDAVVGHLGPDLLDPGWSPELRDQAVGRLAAHPGTTIAEALLDQRNLAGLGTIWRAETLFAARLDPHLAVRDVPDLAGVVDHAHRLLTAAVDQIAPNTTGRRNPSERVFVYGRAGRPCLRCGTPIARDELGPRAMERVLYWCPRCQSSAAVERH